MKEEYFEVRSGEKRRKNETQVKTINTISESFYEDENGEIVEVEEHRKNFTIKAGKVKDIDRRSLTGRRRVHHSVEKCRFFYWIGVIVWSVMTIFSSLAILYTKEISNYFDAGNVVFVVSFMEYLTIGLTMVMGVFTFYEFVFDKYKKRRKFDRYNFVLVIAALLFFIYIFSMQFYVLNL